MTETRFTEGQAVIVAAHSFRVVTGDTPGAGWAEYTEHPGTVRHDNGGRTVSVWDADGVWSTPIDRAMVYAAPVFPPRPTPTAADMAARGFTAGQVGTVDGETVHYYASAELAEAHGAAEYFPAWIPAGAHVIRDMPAAEAVTVIFRDGAEVARVTGDFGPLAWFHKNSSQSMDWALTHEGYSMRPAAEVDAEPRTGSRTVFLGRTADGTRVHADVTLSRHEGPAETVNHETVGGYMGVSVSFTLTAKHCREPYGFGQVDPAERVITDRRGADVTDAERETIETAWRDWHLNGLTAACAHMVPGRDYTEPDADSLPVTYGRPDVMRWRIANVTCAAGSGYRYGAAWLTRIVPADVLAAVGAIVAGA